MDELCSKSAYDDTDLQLKVETFLKDRSIDAVTGIRRMGRENLVDFVAEMANGLGIGCSVYPDTSGKDAVIFYSWEIMKDPAESLLRERPGLDVLHGQDLCHQVPALVRYNKKKRD
ncbi:MAG: hypothetical protein E7Z70_03360 [Thermoplasmata archaeon]|nr:hypothetical protein [Thermoplasmata archaeon]